MDPLPLYIVLLAGLPLVLPLLLRKTWAVVGASMTVYLLAPWMGWNLRAIADGVWYFNPVTWQLLFVLGGAAAIHARRHARPNSGAAATAVVCRGGDLHAACGDDDAVLALARSARARMPSRSATCLPISKTDLSPLRLVHFLALAYVTAKLLPDTVWTRHWLAQHTCRMGRYSLEVFCLGVLLAPLADMLNALAGDALPCNCSALVGASLMAILGSGWN